MAALWPDLDERAAANNLRVTLNYLLAALEPWRGRGEPSFFVRTRRDLRSRSSPASGCGSTPSGSTTTCAGPRRADADGAPSVALDHALAAAALYRGPAHQDVGDAEWVDAGARALRRPVRRHRRPGRRAAGGAGRRRAGRGRWPAAPLGGRPVVRGRLRRARVRRAGPGRPDRGPADARPGRRRPRRPRASSRRPSQRLRRLVRRRLQPPAGQPPNVKTCATWPCVGSSRT